MLSGKVKGLDAVYAPYLYIGKVKIKKNKVILRIELTHPITNFQPLPLTFSLYPLTLKNDHQHL